MTPSKKSGHVVWFLETFYSFSMKGRKRTFSETFIPIHLSQDLSFQSLVGRPRRRRAESRYWSPLVKWRDVGKGVDFQISWPGSTDSRKRSRLRDHWDCNSLRLPVYWLLSFSKVSSNQSFFLPLWLHRNRWDVVTTQILSSSEWGPSSGRWSSDDGDRG